MYVYLFDTVSGALVKRLGPLSVVIDDLAFSPDGKQLLAGYKNGIRLWDSPFAGEGKTDPKHGANVYGVAFDRSGSGRIATVSYDGMIRLYERGLQLPPKTLMLPGPGLPADVDFAPDGKILAVGSNFTTKIDLISVPDLVKVGEVDTSFADNGKFTVVTWSADGRSLYAGGSYFDAAGTIRLFAGPMPGAASPFPWRVRLDDLRSCCALPEGGVVFGSADPAFGTYCRMASLVSIQNAVSADMRAKHSGITRMPRDAMGVWFGLEAMGARSLALRCWPSSPSRPHVSRRRTISSPQTGTLKIEHWMDDMHPTLDGKPIPLETTKTPAASPSRPTPRASSSARTGRSIVSMPRANKLWQHQDRRRRLGRESLGRRLDRRGRARRWHDPLVSRLRWRTSCLTFFVHVPDKRWIAWTPSGYYAASPGGEDLIGWHVNGKTWDVPVDFFPASLFRDKFYRPDIVQLVLKTKDEAKAIAEANEIAKRKEEEAKLPAVVEIIADPRGVETDKPDLALKYRLRSPSGRAVTRLEVRIDGRPIESKGIETFDESSSSIPRTA